LPDPDLFQQKVKINYTVPFFPKNLICCIKTTENYDTLNTDGTGKNVNKKNKNFQIFSTCIKLGVGSGFGSASKWKIGSKSGRIGTHNDADLHH
jgi:hypothetical protein